MPVKPAPEEWTRLGPTQTVAQRVADALRDRILRGDYPPETFIRQDDVATGLGVSRMPVREALAELVSEGFVRRVPRRGFQIPARSVNQLVELYPILTTLEQLACKASLPLLTPADVARLRRVDRAIRRATTQRQAGVALESNLEFHRLLASRAGNGRLLELLDQLGREILQLEFWSFAQPSHRAHTNQSHDAIVAAVASGRHRRALELIQANRMLTYDDFLTEFGSRKGIGPLAGSGSRAPEPAPRPKRRSG